ncbi:hypothetical protein ABIC27_004917 [Streptomyces sp. PvR034]
MLNGSVIAQEHWYEATGEEFAEAGQEVRIPNFPAADAWLGSTEAAARPRRPRGCPERATVAERVCAEMVPGAAAGGPGRVTPTPFFSAGRRGDRSLRAAAGALPRIRDRDQAGLEAEPEEASSRAGRAVISTAASRAASRVAPQAHHRPVV